MEKPEISERLAQVLQRVQTEPQSVVSDLANARDRIVEEFILLINHLPVEQLSDQQLEKLYHPVCLVMDELDRRAGILDSGSLTESDESS